MKFQLKNIVAIMAITLALNSCSKDEESPIEDVTGVGEITLEFDNVYGDADFAFNTNYTNSNSEVISVSQIKYIISNIVLTKSDGTTFVYPKSESYFIVDEALSTTQNITLTDVPLGDYKGVKFGIGVDKQQWELGAAGQGDFLTLAQSSKMIWSWTAGYKFVNFEGTFTSPTVPKAANFKVHNGKTVVGETENYNYAEASLIFPNTAFVRKTKAPDVHIFSDLKNIVDGTNKIALSAAAGGNVMGGTSLALITTNLTGMFKVDHIHND